MPKSTRPPKVEPIKPKIRKEPFDDSEWSFELKYDGFRGLLYIDGDDAYFVSKNVKALPRFRRLAKLIRLELKTRNAILDGEIFASGENGLPVFEKMITKSDALSYAAFDLLWVDGKDLRAENLKQRRKLLAQILPDNNSRIISEAVRIDAHGTKLFEYILKYDLEGMIAKRLTDPYERWVRWHKILNPQYSQRIGKSRFFRRKVNV